MLKRRDFDVSGVQLRRDRPVIGFVHREALTSGVVRDHLSPLTAEQLVSDATTSRRGQPGGLVRTVMAGAGCVRG